MENINILPDSRDNNLAYFAFQGLQLIRDIQSKDEILSNEFARLYKEHIHLYMEIDSFNPALANELMDLHLNLFVEPTKLYDDERILESFEKENSTYRERLLKLNEELQHFNHIFKTNYPTIYLRYVELFQENSSTNFIEEEIHEGEKDVLATSNISLEHKKPNSHKKSVSKSLSKSVLKFLSVALPLMIFVMAIKNYSVQSTAQQPINYLNKLGQLGGDAKTPKEDIRSVLDNLEQMAKIGETAIEAKATENYAATNLYQKSTEELKASLLSPIQISDKTAFHKELETHFEVGKHKDFFIRQTNYCQNKLDLAVVGMGIIRIDEVLKGENPTVLEKDKEEFIKYIRDQVQIAIASTDQNYKSIVFKGLESSSN